MAKLGYFPESALIFNFISEKTIPMFKTLTSRRGKS